MKDVLPTLTSDFKNTRVVCPSGVVSFLYGVCKLLWMLLFNFIKKDIFPTNLSSKTHLGVVSLYFHR